MKLINHQRAKYTGPKKKCHLEIHYNFQEIFHDNHQSLTSARKFEVPTKISLQSFSGSKQTAKPIF